MSAPEPLSPAVEARFRALAGCVPDEDWRKLVGATTEAVFKRLAASGVITDAGPEALQRGMQLVGQLLVDHTNVVLTAVAAGSERQGDQP